MFCPKCGKENSDSVKFCVGCGAPFEKSAPAEPLEFFVRPEEVEVPEVFETAKPAEAAKPEETAEPLEFFVRPEEVEVPEPVAPPVPVAPPSPVMPPSSDMPPSPVRTPEAYRPEPVVIPKAPVKKKKTGLIIGIIAAVIVIAVGAFLAGRYLFNADDSGKTEPTSQNEKKNDGENTPEDKPNPDEKPQEPTAVEDGSVQALKKHNKGYLDANANAYLSIYNSPYADVDKDKLEETKEWLEEEKQEREDEGVSISFKDYKVSKQYKKSEVDDIAEYLSGNFDYDTDEHKLQALEAVRYTAVVKEDGDTESDTVEHVMMKVEGKWYLCPLGTDQIKSILKS